MQPIFIYDQSAPKRASNLSINSSLLEQARAYKINLSKLLEHALIDTLQQQKAEEWRRNNKAALQAYNERIEQRGVFSDGLRQF